MTHIEHEKKIVSKMISIYCQKNHKYLKLCHQCKDLESFAHKRLNVCPYQEKKSFCAYCKTQCYSKSYKENMIEVMKFSGKFMLLYHPILFFQHALMSLLNRKYMKIVLIVLLLMTNACHVSSDPNDIISSPDTSSGASGDATTSASIVDLSSFQYYTSKGFTSSTKKKVLFVISDPRKDSVTYDLAKTAIHYFETHNFEVQSRDLYELKWSPVLWLSEFFYQKDGKGSIPTDVNTEQSFVRQADYLIFVYPNWHDTPNAMLKGYMERVFAAGFAYKNGAPPKGLLNGKKIYTIMNAGGLGGGRGWIGDGSDKWDRYMNAFKVFDDDLAEWWGMSPVGTDIGNLGRFVNDRTPKNVLDFNNQTDKKRYSDEIQELRTALTNKLQKIF